MAKAADRGDTGDQKLEPLIFVVRGQRVMLDADLARLYGVTTKRFNEGLSEIASGFRRISLFSSQCQSSVRFDWH